MHRSLVLAAIFTACASAPSDPADAGPDTDASVPDAGPEPETCPEGAFEWPGPTAPVDVPPSDAWKARLTLPDDPFVAVDYDDQFEVRARWAKGVVLVRDPTKVYFQDARHESFHGPFAIANLPPFKGFSLPAFDRVALHAADQQAALVTLILPADETRHEVGVQLVRADPYHPDQAIALLRLVRDSVDVPEGTRFLYMPTWEQAACARASAAAFEAAGFPLADPGRFQADSASCYANGWAVGTLRFVEGSAIAGAYASGALGPGDVLLTDVVPAEVPFVQGIVALSASTPSSHVAILAQQYGAPFAAVLDPAEHARVRALAGKQVAYSTCPVRLFATEGLVPDAELARLAIWKKPDSGGITPARHAGQLVLDVDDLAPAQRDVVGGKAANYGVLRDAIPENARDAAAITFDVFETFLATPVGANAKATVEGFQWPAETAELAVELARVRAAIETTPLPATITSPLLQALSTKLPTTMRLKFRSSTNAEDGATFTGAGLYDSFAGCVADDLDADEVGPSRCDPARDTERSALAAIRRVFASFYNDNAVLERLRRGLREADVRMGVLASPAFADEDELANGVATTRRTSWGFNVELVTQRGAVSVTNPDGSAVPERVQISFAGDYLSLTEVESSSLVPRGARVLTWDDATGRGEYRDLATLLRTVSDRWEELEHPTRPFALDFEFKKATIEGRSRLFVKQVRPLPLPSDEPRVPTLLLPPERPWCPLQGENADLFAIHRLSSRLRPELHARLLDATGLAQPILEGVSYEWVDDGARRVTTGAFSTLAGSRWSHDDAAITHTFEVDATSPGGRRTVTLRFERPAGHRLVDSPFRTLDELNPELVVSYARPAPFVGYDPEGHAFDVGIYERREESVRLVPCTLDDAQVPGELAHDDSATAAGRTFEAHYFWPPQPTGIVAGYTAPLARWGETTLTGVLDDAIVLRSSWSQTTRPGHHNFGADYLFEPRLEPDLPAATLAALRAADVAALAFFDGRSTAWVVGFDGRIRAISQ